MIALTYNHRISFVNQWNISIFNLQVLANAERPMILVGNTVLQGQEGAATHQVVADMSQKLKSSKKVDKEWKVLNVLHRVRVHP